jgi:YbbR domain-containing protein
VSWITESWRLKLLALGLSVLMLGAVAFAQNPPTSKTLTVPIVYQGTIPSSLVLINPPTKTSARVTGLADTLTTVSASNVTASFDLSKATAGPSVKVNLIVKPTILGVTVENPIVPTILHIDRLVSIKLTVVARTPRVTPGWQVTKSVTSCAGVSPCIVTFTGPQSWEADPQSGKTNLTAYSDFPSLVENGSQDVGNIPIVLVQNGSNLDLTTFTVPQISLDVTSVTLHIEAKTGTSSRQVVLIDSLPSHYPPTGYRLTSVTINPITVVISGPPDVLGKITTLSLPALDLSGHTSDVIFRVTIPYPNGVTGSVLVARVTCSISANPSTQP